MTSAQEGKSTDTKIVILDTNVLLADPNSILSFPRAEVVIPETVLGELDKLKTARVDPDLRFRGREVSRLLFELSEDGSLVGGVETPDGGRIRVAPFDTEGDLPDGMQTRNSDDRILATAFQVYQANSARSEVTLLTNDLNMLLKAQTLGIPVERYGEGVEGGFARRYIIRPFQRYKVPIAILAIAIAVFAAVIVIVVVARQQPSPSRALPTEFRQILSSQQQNALDALTALEGDPQDSDALKVMGDFYFDAVTNAQQAGDQAGAINFSKRGVRYYEEYLEQHPDDNDARSDLASLLFYSGQTDAAIREVGQVLENDPKHINGNFNLGIFYLQGRRDLQAAADQMQKVIDLTADNQNPHVNEQAKALLEQIKNETDGSNSTTGTQGAQ